MFTKSTMKTIAGVLCVAAALPSTAFAERTIRCESRNYRYQFCRADTDYRVRLVHQRSSTHCRQGVNWGYDARGVWVDRGCAAEFEVGRYDGRGGSGSGTAVAVGATVAGLAIAAAIAANRDKHDTRVPSWAVGSFRGYDSRERTTVEVTVLPGGSVTGLADGSEFTGFFDDKRLEAGRQRFRVERAGNGFIATDENDSRHQVVFSRAGSGYSRGGY